MIFRFWGLTPKPTAKISIGMGEFVGLVETVATRYYSTPYVGGTKCKVGLPQNFEPQFLKNWSSDSDEILQIFRGYRSL